MKKITIYHADGHKTLADYIAIVRREFPGIPFEKVKMSLGIVSVCFEADTDHPRSRMRRVFKSQI